MTEPASPAWYANERAVGRFWVTDPQFPDPTNDVGLGVQAALNAIVAAAGGNGSGGRILVPALPNGASWTWKTNIVQIINENGLDIELCGMPGTIITLNLNNKGSYAYMVINDFNGSLSVRDIVFLGPSTGTGDCAALCRLSANKCVVERVQCYGLSTNLDNTGLFMLGGALVRQLQAIGCGHVGTHGGVIYISGGQTNTVEQSIFNDIGSFQGIGYGAIEGFNGAWLYMSDGHALNVMHCEFDEAQNSHVWVDCQTNVDAGIVIESTGFNTANPSVGTNPASVRVTSLGAASVILRDIQFNSSANRTAFDVTNVMQLTLERCQGTYTNQTTTLQNIIGICRSGNGSFSFIDNAPDVSLDTSVAAPTLISDTRGGVQMIRPIGKTAGTPWETSGCAAAYIPTLGSFISPLASDLGTGATYAPVTANHHLDLIIDGNVPITITFTGSENSQSTFFTAINAVTNLFSASNSGGQTLLTAQLLNGISAGFISATSSVDVLGHLGLSAGPFTTPAIIAQLIDESGVADATHNLAGVGTSLIAADPNFGGQVTMAFRGTQDLVSSTWTTPLAQPFAIMFVGRQRIAATAYVSDGATADQCSISGNAANSAITLNAGAAAAFPVSDTTKPHIYVFVVNGASSQLYLDCETPTAVQNAGTNALGAVTIGNQAGGAALAGWDIAEWYVRPLVSGVTTYQLARQFLAYASKRFGVPLLPPVTAIGSLPWTPQTAGTYTLNLSQFVNGEINIDADTTSGTITDTLPTAPPDGTIARFSDFSQKWNTNSLTVTAGGTDLMQDPNNITAAMAASVTLNVKGASVTWKYRRARGIWGVV